MHARLRSFVVPAAIGLLIVPAAALAGVRLLAEPDEPIPSPTPAVTASDDLALACGAEGLALVEAERTGEVDPLSAAALQALRPICAEAGLPLPDAPTPEPVVVVESVVVPPPPVTAGGTAVAAAAPPVQPAVAPPADDDSGHGGRGDDDDRDDRDDDDRDDRDDDDRDDRDDDRDDRDDDRDEREDRDDDD